MGVVTGGEIIETLGALGIVKAPDARIMVVDPSDSSFSIEDALSEAVDGQGDIIVSLPGSHGGAASIAFDKTGVICLAAGYGHPEPFKGESFMLRTAAGVATVPGVTVTKPCRIIGMGITGRDITKESLLIDCLEAGGINGGFNSFEYCRFPAWYGAMDAFVRGVGGAVNRFYRCTFDGLFGGVATAAVQLEDDAGGINPTFWRFEECEFSGLGASKPAIKIKTGSTALDLALIRNRLLPGFSGNQGVMADLNSSASTGMAIENHVAPLPNKAAAFLNVASAVGFGFANNHYEE